MSVAERQKAEKKRVGHAVVACSGTSPALEAAGHNLDTMRVPPVVIGRTSEGCRSRDTRPDGTRRGCSFDPPAAIELPADSREELRPLCNHRADRQSANNISHLSPASL